MRVLSRTWQMLLKGIAEVRDAGKPIAAAEMVLVRIAYAADLPTPDEAIRSLDSNGARSAGNGGAAAGSADASAPTSRPQAFRTDSAGSAARALPASVAAPMARAEATPAVAINTFDDLIALAGQKRDLQIRTALERDVRLVRCEDGRLEIALENGAAKAIVGDLARKLTQWTGRRWMVVISAEAGAPTLKAQSEAKQAELKTGVQAHPLVQSVLTRFPGAQITRVQRREQDLPPDVPPDPSDDGAAEPMTDNDDSTFGARGADDHPGEF
jgi:DNA polymerase-3 subunit gamma/tau